MPYQAVAIDTDRDSAWDALLDELEGPPTTPEEFEPEARCAILPGARLEPRELEPEPLSGTRPRADKALRAYYGASDRQAQANTVKACIGAGSDRPQQILTPRPILDVIERLWPEGIALDPCGAPGSLVQARAEFGPHVEAPELHDGLALPWVDRTYLNPPFKYWADWLAKACAEHAAGVQEIVALGPVRMQRRWYRAAWRNATLVVGLNPVKFVGYDSSLPESMCLLYWGLSPAVLGELVEASGLGEVMT